MLALLIRLINKWAAVPRCARVLGYLDDYFSCLCHLFVICCLSASFLFLQQYELPFLCHVFVISFYFLFLIP
ncbi:hypothetical protein T492DRAFT_1003212 [Pavlovales sp. CCMP2436]|nr:hypothetical protein T492DRAFT_1003212 [Pavlovales sp. CCMP2436]